jgi:hypothetical protein
MAGNRKTYGKVDFKIVDVLFALKTDVAYNKKDSVYIINLDY